MLPASPLRRATNPHGCDTATQAGAGRPGNESGAASSRLAAQATSPRAALLGAAALPPDNIQRARGAQARAIPELQPVPTVKTASDGAKHGAASCARKPINPSATALPAPEDTNEGRPADAPSSASNFRCGHESPRGPTCRIPGGRQRQALNLSENVRATTHGTAEDAPAGPATGSLGIPLRILGTPRKPATRDRCPSSRCTFSRESPLSSCYQKGYMQNVLALPYLTSFPLAIKLLYDQFMTVERPSGPVSPATVPRIAK